MKKNKKLQLIYFPVRVEGASGNYIPNKNVLIVKEQGDLDKYWESLVAPQESVVFSKDEYNKFLEDFGKEILNKASQNVKTETVFVDNSDWGNGVYKDVIIKKTITEVLPTVLDKYKL